MIGHLLVIALTTILCLNFAQSEYSYFTSLDSMKKLLVMENTMIEDFNLFITGEEDKLEKMIRLTNEVREIHREAKLDFIRYVSNPLNSFKLIKRLTRGLEDIVKMLENEFETLVNAENQFPSDVDLSGAVAGLIRLQHTYDMDTSDMAVGKIRNIHYNTQLSASDCAEIGIRSIDEVDGRFSISWMQEALKRYEEEEVKSCSLQYILENLVQIASSLGEYAMALEYADKLLEVDNNEENVELKKEVKEEMLESEKNNSTNENSRPEEPAKFTIYRSLCLDHVLQKTPKNSQLVCHYEFSKSPFLTIAPLKCEEICKSPLIVMYHDVIYDSEIEIIKNLTSNELQNAKVIASKDDIVSFRITKTAWLFGWEHPVINRITQRVADMTGLNTNTSEAYQVGNYGVGGHYRPHYDFVHGGELSNAKGIWAELGNRIATVLFYLSDCDQGGSTVFPNINVTVPAKKGAAAVWFNLYTDGSGDFRTMHGSCPVLGGEKWIMTKWIHERGQEFTRPCLEDWE